MPANHYKRRLNSIRLMMIAAQLLLLGFIIYWLTGQYQEQKHSLLKEVRESWSSAEQQILDSVLMKEYVHQAIDSSLKFDFKYEFNTDSLKLESYNYTSRHPIGIPGHQHSRPHKGGKVFINIDDSIGQEIKLLPVPEDLDKNDLILKSVKLIVNEINDSSGRTFNISSWTSATDTNLLKQVFKKKLQGIDPGMEIRWNTLPGIDPFQPKHGKFIFSTNDGEKSLQAGVTGIHWHIFRKILPQMLFALFLLALTFAAFIISFRSYKAQLILNMQRSDFIHNMSHELKTPVATVKVALEALKNFDRKKDPEKMDEYLAMASAETDRLEMLVNRVMQIPENGGDNFLNLSPVDLRDIVNETIRTLRPRFERESASVSVKETGNQCKVSADSLHIQGVILNLIDNSLKYCEANAVIELEIICDPGFVYLNLIDKGTQIPLEYRDKIFDKFFRVPSGDVHNVKGYGLGLSYAKAIMQLHGGKILYEAPSEGGNLFKLVFPKYLL